MTKVLVEMEESERDAWMDYIVTHAEDGTLIHGYSPQEITMMDALRAAKPAGDEFGVTGETSDGYHTFDELYEHRHALFLWVMRLARPHHGMTWIDDDPNTPDWFLAGVDSPAGQISYHLPRRLLTTAVQHTSHHYERKPFDGYTADDVLNRIQIMAGYHQSLRRRPEGG